jgi:GNAT superfamily N-acetyltransferase
LITIRRIQPGEAELFKHVRLTALQDAPYAFLTTYDSALQRSAESWREQADRSAQGTDRATFIAYSDDLPIGMAALYRLEEKPEAGELIQVWIDVAYRGSGVARDLLDVIFKWARENNFHSILAGITKGNNRALQFYIKYGFSVLEETPGGVSLAKEVN